MIERLLVVKLDVVDCEAEAWLNGVPVLRADAARASAIVPAHEFILAGMNRLELVLWPRPAVLPPDAPLPPPVAVQATGHQAAHLRLLLPRIGNPADEASARTLGQIDWTPAAGHGFQAPLTLSQDLTLPVSFPRWRWFEAPVVELGPALRQSAHDFLQQIAQALTAGDPEPFLAATRLRTEELAVAYQRNAADEAARLRSRLLDLAAAQRLNWLPIEADGLALRSVAGGRLLECLDQSGLPMLRTEADAAGATLAFPMRMAAVEGRFYVLR